MMGAFFYFSLRVFHKLYEDTTELMLKVASLLPVYTYVVLKTSGCQVPFYVYICTQNTVVQ